MLSEFELKRRQKLFDDLSDVMLNESSDQDIVCGECGSPLFKLDAEHGIVCADPECSVIIDVTTIEV